ncbi:histidine phosphatase family protein [Actinomadura rudentiformis]|uniref:MSMEG_4193 family putative phosphomutase n=1 Tax=Actinomadura rudentiformis TaxID=359158 RepID=A0A6H9Z2H2_9ACTN|nr:histidine phosphatase family protein [Actinomadura rudentiformis]KAB2348929.1 MSMEG_4193 family putative phosphomutase [Actinomadura rudentiformis]
MTTLLLVRHGLTALTGPVLAGWTPDLHLDERGRTQVRDLGARIAGLPLRAVVSSPLDRCLETAEAIAAGHGDPIEKIEVDERFGEVRYGDWTGRPLEELAKEPLWRVVQAHPSAARFPGEDGESLAAAQHRAVEGVRDWNERVAAEHGPDAMYAVCSHGDIIKAIVADALGLHLDQFQRIQADPASLTVIRYTELRPFVVRLNDTGGGVADLIPKPAANGGSPGGGDGDAPVGGGA